MTHQSFNTTLGYWRGTLGYWCTDLGRRGLWQRGLWRHIGHDFSYSNRLGLFAPTTWFFNRFWRSGLRCNFDLWLSRAGIRRWCLAIRQTDAFCSRLFLGHFLRRPLARCGSLATSCFFRRFVLNGRLHFPCAVARDCRLISPLVAQATVRCLI